MVNLRFKSKKLNYDILTSFKRLETTILSFSTNLDVLVELSGLNRKGQRRPHAYAAGKRWYRGGTSEVACC